MKAHIGIEGNEEADKAAKEGADTLENTYDISIPWSAKQALIRQYSLQLWTNRWTSIEGHTQTKLFFCKPDPNKATGIIRLSRGYLTNLIRAITGHNFLGKHQNKIDHTISKVCRFCDEEIETFHHFITECPSLRQLRTEIFQDKPITPDNTRYDIFHTLDRGQWRPPLCPIKPTGSHAWYSMSQGRSDDSWIDRWL